MALNLPTVRFRSRFSNPATRVTYNSVQRMFDLRSCTGPRATCTFSRRRTWFVVPPFALRFREHVSRRARSRCAVARHFRSHDARVALHKAFASTRCKNLLLLTLDGRAPARLLVHDGTSVEVEAVVRWLLAR